MQMACHRPANVLKPESELNRANLQASESKEQSSMEQQASGSMEKVSGTEQASGSI